MKIKGYGTLRVGRRNICECEKEKEKECEKEPLLEGRKKNHK